MDEPLSNLDALLRVEMRTELLRLHKRVGRTTIYVTHDQIEAMTMASRIVLMNRGKIQQVGSPTEIYVTPANTFVARFVGSPAMNLIEGRIEGGKDGPVFRGPVELPAGGIAGLAAGPATVGIRPEHIEIVSSGQSRHGAGEGRPDRTGRSRLERLPDRRRHDLDHRQRRRGDSAPGGR